MSENHPQHGHEQSQPETHLEGPEASAQELGGLGLAAASQPDEVLDSASSSKPMLRVSTTAASRLPHYDRWRINNRAIPERSPETSKEPSGRDFPMRRGSGKSNS